METSDLVIRAAKYADVSDIAQCVHNAYVHYVPILGMKPNPMLDDYGEIIEHCCVFVIANSDLIMGVIVLEISDEGFLLDNIAVHPKYQGRGLGSLLLDFAEQEAMRNGYSSIYLYTNVKMTENQIIYKKRGYVEFARRNVNGRHGVFMRKFLANANS
jgi:GNAT superfamily N-acetyltransferase